jgi:hypothetical protein
MISCTVPYDAETRLLFETTLVDSNENNLKGIDLEIRVSNGTGFATSGEIISHGKTNANGKLNLIFPSPKFEDNYRLFIRSKNDENLSFVPFGIGNIDIKNFNDYKLSIPKIYRLTYEESVSVALNFIPTNNSKKITDIIIDGIYSPSNSSYIDEDDNYIYAFFAKKNQTIHLTYTVKNLNSGILETVTQEINIQEVNLNETINY